MCDDCCEKQEPGCVPQGVVSINGDLSQLQTITGDGGITVATNHGNTVITGSGGTITDMTAPQMFISPVTSTGHTLNLSYSGQPIIIPVNSNASQLDQRSNNSSGTIAEVGYQAINDLGDSFSMALGGSGNTVKPDGGAANARRGIIRNSSTAFGMDIDQQGSEKQIRLMTDDTARLVVDDTGVTIAEGDFVIDIGEFNIVAGSIVVDVGSITVDEGNISAPLVFFYIVMEGNNNWKKFSFRIRCIWYKWDIYRNGDCSDFICRKH